MARDDYGAINVISDEERDSLGIGGPKKPEDEKLFETIADVLSSGASYFEVFKTCFWINFKSKQIT